MKAHVRDARVRALRGLGDSVAVSGSELAGHRVCKRFIWIRGTGWTVARAPVVEATVDDLLEVVSNAVLPVADEVIGRDRRRLRTVDTDLYPDIVVPDIIEPDIGPDRIGYEDARAWYACNCPCVPNLVPLNQGVSGSVDLHYLAQPRTNPVPQYQRTS